MKSVLLRLEGPLQAWGTQGRFGVRDTDTEPSKSGVLGLVGAALGMSRDDTETLELLASLQMAIRADREGSLLRDYHTAGGGTFRGRPHRVWGTKDPVPTQRFYLADASFLVALGSDDHALVDRIAAALSSPRWPMFLGRKACAPAVDVLSGVVERGPEDAVRSAPWTDRAVPGERVRLILEAASPDGARLRQDVPLSFARHARAHAQRFVRVAWMDGPPPVSEAT